MERRRGGERERVAHMAGPDASEAYWNAQQRSAGDETFDSVNTSKLLS